jgi:predicted PurR-regulated permease PerM
MPVNPVAKGKKFFFGFFFVIAFLAFSLISDFWIEILLAFTTAFVLHPYYQFLQRKYKLGQHSANFVVIFSSLIFLIIPLTFIGSMVLRDAFLLQDMVKNNWNLSNVNLNTTLIEVNTFLSKLPFVEKQITIQDVNDTLNAAVAIVTNFIIRYLSGALGSVANIFFSMILYVIMLFFLIPNMTSLYKYFKDLSPLDNQIDEYFMTKAHAMIKDMLKGTVVIGIVQSLIVGITFWLLGVDYVLTLFVITCVFSIIPVLGTVPVTISVAIVLLLTGNLFAAIVIILVQAVIVGNIDNVLRPMLVSEQARLHPALVILGVLGGLNFMGMLGVIYGPVIMILLVTAAEIYKRYYR